MNTRVLTTPIALSGLEAAINQANVAVLLKHDDLDNESVSGTPTQTLAAFDVVAGDVVAFRGMSVRTAFSDASDNAFNSLLLEVGDGDNTGRYLGSTQINVNGTEVMYAGGAGTAINHQHPLTSLATGLSTSAIDILSGFTPGFSGEIIGFEFVTTVVGTGTSASQVFNLEVGTTNLTGGVLTLTLASQGTIGAITAATAITGGNTFGPTDTISIEMAAGGTVFTAGAGYFVIKMRRLEGAAGVPHTYTADDTVDIKVTSTASKALAELDGGALVLFFEVNKLKELRKAILPDT